jgi:ABC-type nitrate/sulfonate/bicarbonate transport system ATPase subunit
MIGIDIRSVTKAYSLAGGERKVALHDVDLAVEPGEFVCLLGPSGCGKSTLLNIVSGLDREFEGEVSFRGDADPQIGYIFQEARLLPWMTVRDNLRFVLDGGDRTSNDRRIEDWLDRIGLRGYGGYFPGELSIGMQQRVSVARALIREPELLLMDEPFSSLDELTALRMRSELLELWSDQASTVLFVTHNPMEAVYLADRVIVMTPSPGRISQQLNVGAELPRPRDYEDQRLWEVSRTAVSHLIGAEPTAG